MLDPDDGVPICVMCGTQLDDEDGGCPRCATEDEIPELIEDEGERSAAVIRRMHRQLQVEE